MTEGTSQGLFIVVAIVIFGIFVSLSYTLFGSQGLSNDLKVLFTDATEQVTDKLGNSKNLVTPNDFDVIIDGREPDYNLVKTDDTITFSSEKGKFYAGIFIPETFMDINSSYTFEYDIKLIEGELDRIGGHLYLPKSSDFYFDGQLQDTLYYEGIPFKPELNEIHKVKVNFTTDDTPLTILNRLYIQPNRVKSKEGNPNAYNTDYRVEISNITLIKK